MRLQTQPTPVTCVQTCLAMALDVPVEQVIRHYGPEPMNAKGLLNALTECGIPWNQLTQGTMLHTGFYFAVVPSLNHRGGMHQIVIAYDSSTGGMTVFDPAIGNRYREDGSDLISWAELVAFYPRGRLPLKWYTEEELRHYLSTSGYSKEITEELCAQYAANLQRAFDKGREIGLRESKQTA